jgi:hypothetical protein
MATYFRTKVHTDLTTTPTDILQTVDNNRFTIIGCNVANKIDEDIIVDVLVQDATSATGFYAKGVVIPPYTSAKIITNGEKLILAETCALRMTCDTENAADVTISYAEIV